MISRALAVRLAPHLQWVPQNGDHFFINRGEISDAIFMVSDMVVELVRAQGESRFHFNGTTEWALDSVEDSAAVWLPTEGQLRERLGERFLSLDREGAGYVVSATGSGGATHTAPQGEAVDAYAVALLTLLEGSGGAASEPQPPVSHSSTAAR